MVLSKPLSEPGLSLEIGKKPETKQVPTHFISCSGLTCLFGSFGKYSHVLSGGKKISLKNQMRHTKSNYKNSLPKSKLFPALCLLCYLQRFRLR